MVESYLPGSVDNKGNIVDKDGHIERINPIMIRVFRDGVQVASHRIHDVLGRTHLVSPSTSHVGWTRAVPDLIASPSFAITT